MVTAKSQQGSVLITVISALAILAAVAHVLATQQGMLNSRFSRQKNQVAAQYVAEAGLRDALLHTRKKAPPYSPVINGTLSGIGSYQAMISPTSGVSPVTIQSTGTAGDAQVTLAGSYPIRCAGKGTSTKLITTYDAKGAPLNMSETNSSMQQGYLHPRNNTDNRSRVLIKFDLTPVPKAVTIISARLILDVQQHDPSMEGGALLVNRVITAWESGRADWLSNLGGKTRWSSPGGDFSLVNEAQATIAAGVLSYDWEIASFVDGWVNGKFSDGHNGLIIRADRASTVGSGTDLRLKRNSGSNPVSQWPRLEVVHCNP